MMTMSTISYYSTTSVCCIF